MSTIKCNRIENNAGTAGFDVATIPDAGSFSMRNKLINGGFDIWQRGDSGTSGYQADRWFLSTGGAYLITEKLNGSVKNYMRLRVSTSGSVVMLQKVEDVRTLNGRKATVSFEIDGNTNTIDFVKVYLQQKFDNGGAEDTTTAEVEIDISAGGTYSATFDVPTTEGKARGSDSYLSTSIKVGTATGILAITNIQLEEGSVATPFEQRPIGLERLLCFRYFWATSGPHYGSKAALNSNSTVLSHILVPFPTIMRVDPTITKTEANITLNSTTADKEHARFYGTPTNSGASARINVATFSSEL